MITETLRNQQIKDLEEIDFLNFELQNIDRDLAFDILKSGRAFINE